MQRIDLGRLPPIEPVPGREAEYTLAHMIVSQLQLYEQLHRAHTPREVLDSLAVGGAKAWYGTAMERNKRLAAVEKRELARWMLSEEFVDDCLMAFDKHPRKLLEWMGVPREQLLAEAQSGTGLTKEGP